jgi:hypothetical protein
MFFNDKGKNETNLNLIYDLLFSKFTECEKGEVLNVIQPTV